MKDYSSSTLRQPAVQLGINKRRDIDAVHDDVLQLLTYLDADQLCRATGSGETGRLGSASL